MKTKNIIIFFLISLASVVAQTASSYFPAQQGFRWTYKSVPLDSLNNPVDSLRFYGIDSFSVVTPYVGKTANVVLSKTGTENTINSIPFLDSSYYNFDGTNGFEYFDPTLAIGLLGNVDTTLGINFVTFFNSLEGWYSYYRFASGNDVEYQIFKKDTAITVNTISATIRFELIGKKLQDESLETEIGTFECKKFLLEVRISYLLLNIIPIKMFGVENTVWLAPDNWKVKSYIPTTNVDLSYLGFPAFKIPGLESNISSPITNLEENNFEMVSGFQLDQNYPNPFNPSTKISWYTSVGGWQTIKIYNALGREIGTILNEYLDAGLRSKLYTVNSEMPSGIYFYQLQAGNFIQTKKMIFLK
jgi:hypothetical protein